MVVIIVTYQCSHLLTETSAAISTLYVIHNGLTSMTITILNRSTTEIDVKTCDDDESKPEANETEI